jgi:4,5-DOPA dioxygenase extradiol
MLPTLFVSHGAPTLALEHNKYTEFLGKLNTTLPKPKAIVLFSAHWDSSVQMISSRQQHETFHDFYGFPDEMYRLSYPALGSLPLALEIQQLFTKEGIRAELDDHRGMDHGVWVPLMRMFPQADVPIVPLSVNPRHTPEELYRTGRALRSLREHDVLIIGSGGVTHNLRKIDFRHPDGSPMAFAAGFEEWIQEQLETWNLEALFDYENRTPLAKDAVPTTEHFYPLILAMGAADEGKQAKLLHKQFQFGSLGLTAWMFG